MALWLWLVHALSLLVAASRSESYGSVFRSKRIAEAVALAHLTLLPLVVNAAAPNGVTYTRTTSGISYFDYPSTSVASDETRQTVKDGSKVAIDVKGYLAGRNGWNFIDTKAIEDGEIRLVMGKTRMIAGLEMGLLGTREGDMKAMSRGDKRRLVIPSRLGYQDRGQQPLPADDDFRRRLFSTVFNEERGARESAALGGDSVVGEIILDVRVAKVKN